VTNDEWDRTERRSKESGPISVADVRELKESVIALATAVGQAMTREETEASIRRTRRINGFQFLLTVLTVVVLGSLILNDQADIKELGKANRESIGFLEACLVPGNPCAESLQQQFDVNRNQIQHGIGCVLLTPIETRTRALIEACFAEARAKYPKPVPPQPPPKP
jgi:hypothetical protein